MFITTNNLEIFPQSVGTFSHFLQTAATTLRVEQRSSHLNQEPLVHICRGLTSEVFPQILLVNIMEELGNIRHVEDVKVQKVVIN